MTLAAALIFTGDASAATLRLLPSARTFTIGQEFTVDLLLDTDLRARRSLGEGGCQK